MFSLPILIALTTLSTLPPLTGPDSHSPIHFHKGAPLEPHQLEPHQQDRRGRAFLAIHGLDGLTLSKSAALNSVVLDSPPLSVPVATDEIIVSWNATTPQGTGLKVEARAHCGDHWTKYYTMGLWSKDGGNFPRESVNGQKDADGDVSTDTLKLNRPADTIALRVTLHGDASLGIRPTMKFLGVSLADTHAHPTPLEPDKAVWGKEVTVPGKPQTGYPDANGWCSPTSTAMTLAFWSQRLHRPELDMEVPVAAHAIYDKVYDGTGNWPFNTAFAGSFPGIRAYVTRFSDIRELEAWTEAGLPVVVSVSYDLLKGKEKDEDPGHLMVCDGFTKEGDIVLNDPAHHPERGEVCRRVFSRANFLRGWGRSKYLVYLIYPEGTKVPADPYGHWDSGQ